MNNRAILETTLKRATEKCQDHGEKLTPKRSLILRTMIEAGSPLSAYDIINLMNSSHHALMPATSVYRILSFLESVDLVHKLSSENKYVACEHISCHHQHESPQFLICQKCNKVKEINISHSVIDEIKQHVKDSDYKLIDSVLEISCICKVCQMETNNT
ncbi:Fur family transcriptional regulator [Marinicella sp. W31]|uniref:Fur family transcriptional regulator n=1 Tax=Marinicella sp. W31 TaxID=3023713 RepID=UPI0037577327